MSILSCLGDLRKRYGVHRVLALHRPPRRVREVKHRDSGHQAGRASAAADEDAGCLPNAHEALPAAAKNMLGHKASLMLRPVGSSGRSGGSGPRRQRCRARRTPKVVRAGVETSEYASRMSMAPRRVQPPPTPSDSGRNNADDLTAGPTVGRRRGSRCGHGQPKWVYEEAGDDGISGAQPVGSCEKTRLPLRPRERGQEPEDVRLLFRPGDLVHRDCGGRAADARSSPGAPDRWIGLPGGRPGTDGRDSKG
jgi:hypothetical protein